MEQAEKDLAITLEGDWAKPVVITRIDTPSTTQSLIGQVLYDFTTLDADGVPTIDNKPVVTLRQSTLETIPNDGEDWYFDIQATPVNGSPVVRYVFDNDSGLRGFRSLGIITYPLRVYVDERT